LATALGLTIVKAFPYRDNTAEEFSNQYWLSGPPPSDDAGWQACLDDILVHEKTLYTARTHVVAAYGYDSNDDHAHSVWNKQYPPGTGPVGTLPVQTAETRMSGDQAAVIEWVTSRKNSRGKWVYLRKYMHDGTIDQNSTDELGGALQAAGAAYATALANGSLLGGRTLRSRKQDETIWNQWMIGWVTTRTLKRRGKRP